MAINNGISSYIPVAVQKKLEEKLVELIAGDPNLKLTLDDFTIHHLNPVSSVNNSEFIRDVYGIDAYLARLDASTDPYMLLPKTKEAADAVDPGGRMQNGQWTGGQIDLNASYNLVYAPEKKAGGMAMGTWVHSGPQVDDETLKKWARRRWAGTHETQGRRQGLGVRLLLWRAVLQEDAPA